MDRYDGLLDELFATPFPAEDAVEDYEGFCALNEVTQRRSWERHRTAFRGLVARITERCGPVPTLDAVDLPTVRRAEETDVPPELGAIVLAVRDRLMVAAVRAFAEAHPEEDLDEAELLTRAGGKLHDDAYRAT